MSFKHEDFLPRNPRQMLMQFMETRKEKASVELARIERAAFQVEQAEFALERAKNELARVRGNEHIYREKADWWMSLESIVWLLEKNDWSVDEAIQHLELKNRGNRNEAAAATEMRHLLQQLTVEQQGQGH